MTKEELTSVYYIKKEIKMWEEQLELIESKAEGKAMQITGLPFSERPSSISVSAKAIHNFLQVVNFLS